MTKSLCAVLIAVLAMHLQCGASCLAGSVGLMEHATPVSPVSIDPPCHKHAEVPANSQPLHEANSPCGQGTIIEGKITAAGRYVLPQSNVVLPATTPVITLNDPFVLRLTPENPRGIWSPLVTLAILRI